MSEKLIKWNVYEISTAITQITGAMFRGRIRKLGLEKNINVLVENAEDIEDRVRFATTNIADYEKIAAYTKSVASDAQIELVLENIANPVLSKLKVNIESRYTL